MSEVSSVHCVFVLLNDIPLKLDGVGAGLAEERVAERRAEGILGKLIPASVTLDGDVFHVCIVVYRTRNATGKGEKVGRVNPCRART